jgi:hypothetical protein
MADYGKNKRFTRAKVPMQVVRGFYPTEPNKLSSLATPLDPAATFGVAIKSGMAIVRGTGSINTVAGKEGFRNAVATDATLQVPIFIALHDADAHDVQASGSLVGLDCSDKFEVQTGYYDPATLWGVNDLVAVGAGGTFKQAVSGDFIVGIVTAVGTGTNGTIISGGRTPSATDMKVIQFKTAQNGQRDSGTVPFNPVQM